MVRILTQLALFHHVSVPSSYSPTYFLVSGFLLSLTTCEIGYQCYKWVIMVSGHERGRH